MDGARNKYCTSAWCFKFVRVQPHRLGCMVIPGISYTAQDGQWARLEGPDYHVRITHNIRGYDVALECTASIYRVVTWMEQV